MNTQCNTCGAYDTYYCNGDNCACTACGAVDDFNYEEKE